MAAILEMPQYVSYQKDVANALLTLSLSTKSDTLHKTCTIMPLSSALVAVLEYVICFEI